MESDLFLHLHAGQRTLVRDIMKLNTSLIKIQLIALICISMMQAACAQSKTASMQKFDYEKAWKEVRQFEDKALPESALKAVNAIYDQAKKDENAAQLVKAIIHQLKFTDYKDENAYVKNLQKLNDEIQLAVYPAKPLLHSMLGEMYWQYYQNNRHRFYNRTQITSSNDNDIETWTLNRIISETFRQYKLSLEDPAKSKATPIDLYDEMIIKGNSKGRRFRPTLFDFLAHRALSFAKQPEASITRPSNAFTIDDERYFSPAQEFVKLKITSQDTLSLNLFALTLQQDIISFHLQDKDPEALTDIDIERLSFVYQHHTSPDKQKYYRQALEQLEKRIIGQPVSTRISFLKASLYKETAGLYKPLQGDDHKWDLKRAVEICDSAVARFRDSEGGIQCANLKVDILTKSLSAVIEENNLPDQPYRALVKYKNFTGLYYRAIKVSREEVREQRRRWDRNYNVDKEQKFIEYFAAKSPLKTGRFTLPDDRDFQEHSLEVKIESLAPGEYMILFSNREDFSTGNNGMAYAFTRISDISYLHRNDTKGGTDCYVLHRLTGEPFAGVTAILYATKYNYNRNSYDPIRIGSFISDSKGYFHVGAMDKERQRTFYFDFSFKGDINSTEPIDLTYGGSINQFKYQRQETHLQTHFFLDRAIYRPGQTIYFKGIVLTTDGKTSSIVPGHKTKLSLYDVNNQIKGEVNVTSNEYGTYSGTFTAPSSGLTGQMRITDAKNTGNVYFSVEEYKRPKFEVVFDTLQGSYRLNDTIKAMATAKAYSGASIDGATVTYRVVRVANFPFWWWSRWGYYPASPEREITHGETTTDANGQFTVKFAAIPDLSVDRSSDPTFEYAVYADVTDINGETHSQSTRISVGYKSLQIGVPMTDINVDQPSVKDININTTNLAGQFEGAKGNIKVFRLKSPGKVFRPRLWEQPDRALYTKEQYYNFFPSDQFADESNKFKWERSNQVFTSDFDTHVKKTFSIADLKSWPTGEYVLEITAKDKDDQEVKELSYFSVYSTSSKKISSSEISYFKAIKLSAEPGETATFLAGTADKGIRVLYELEKDGALLSSEWIRLNNEQRYFEIPVNESHRGNIGIHYTFVRNNRLYKHDEVIVVPFTNKTLDVTFETFRDKLLPGQKEQWRIRIKGKTADKVAAEMVATLYDQSLDIFKPHHWYAQFFSPLPSRLYWESANGFNSQEMIQYPSWNTDTIGNIEGADFDELNWFEYPIGGNFYLREAQMVTGAGVRRYKKSENAVPAPLAMSISEESKGEMEFDRAAANEATPGREEPAPSIDQVPVRTNFNETAFFFPHLQTNESGEIIVNFTVPEALTRWKMLGFAHTKDLKSAFTTNELVTQKEIMVVPNQPRFFREGDKMTFSAKVSSLQDEVVSGEAKLEFFDPLTAQPVSIGDNGKQQLPFTIQPRQSVNLDWIITIPEGLQALSYRIVAKAGNYSDGEEMIIPVVTNRMLVTESLPLPIRGKQTKDFRFEKLLNNKSTTLKHQHFTLEFTSNPAWYAIQALPYMIEYPYDCVEQTFSKYYANSIAAHIANSNPRIRTVFETWRNIQPDALLSNLEKNQELKTALLEETPWVLQANNETQRKRNVGLLFDLNRMANEQEKALEKVAKAQTPNGGFSWFPGFPEDRYMTQHIVTGMGHLNAMGVTSVRTVPRSWDMITNALGYLDLQINDDYRRLKALANKKEIKLEDKHISYLQIQYLYARSYFKDVAVANDSKEAFEYFLGQAKKYWLSNHLYTEGMTCLALHRYGDKEVTSAMIKSFTERALKSEEMGMYWKLDPGFYWYQAPIETHALMIEVFDEVSGDRQAVEDLKVWLLKQKQTQDWKTTKATSEACYALLRRGTDMLANTRLADITVGGTKVDPFKEEGARVEAGTGYFKTAWNASQINSSMGKIHIEKPDDGVAWGAAYWQYFEQLDKITTAETPLKLQKALFKQSNTDNGPALTPVSNTTQLSVGDLIKVRIELRVDLDMEYVHLKDMRAAGFEPVSTISTYRYQDGLYYYESTRDVATNFFIGYLRKGTYVFEYGLRASAKGDFSNGITTVQCMYAPEFSSHSQGIRVQIK